ncbi:MAG: DNA primase family protein [Desulfosalsimonas sp.]
MTDNIRQQVEERIQAEQEASKENDEKQEELSSKFIRECLRANELGDGILYNALHRGRFVFAKSMDTWLVWKGHHWTLDEMDEARAAVENVVIEYLKEAERIKKEIRALRGQKDTETKIKRMEKIQAEIYKRVSALRTMRRRNNCLYAAHTCDRPLAIHGRELDQNAWLLPVANGVVDLKTGKLRDGRPEDYMMKACPFEYHGIEMPREAWEKVLMEIFEDDDLVVAFMQRLFGSAIVGHQFEHIFPVLTGPGGRNGKSTVVETISQVLGPMAAPIRAELLLDTYQVQSSAGPTPDIMALKGLRFAFASETKEGVKISAAKVKWLTGGDELTGRNPHDKYETTFEPTHTLFLLSNFKPSADANDKAFWERMLNVPFNVRFLKNREPSAENERKADLFLKEKLMAEASGILGWLVEGCLKWQMEGLKPPPKVVQETQDYMEDEDNYAAFIDHCLEKGDHLSIGATELYDAFEQWWKRYVGRWVPKQKKFGKQMREFFESRKTGGVYVYYGVDLNDEWRDFMDNN